MNRYGAFLIHLGISLMLFGALAAVVVFVWYPDFFFQSDGGWQGIRIIALVDIVLGPLLTLVVFDRRKPELRRDLAIIGILQFSCLAAGTYVVYSERPLALVYVDGMFYSMSADDYREVGVEPPDLSALPGAYPKRVFVDIPSDFTAQSELRQAAIAERKPLRAHADRYQPFTFESMDSDPVDAGILMEKRPVPMNRWLEAHGGDLDDYAFVPFGARYGYVYLGISAGSREIVGLLDVPRLAG